MEAFLKILEQLRPEEQELNPGSYPPKSTEELLESSNG